jgi:arylsulfatase A-like enzyme
MQTADRALRACLVAGAFLGACQPAASTAGRGNGLLVIAIDGLRADHLPSGGYDRDTAPYLESLFSAGVSFAQCFSTAPFAQAACVSLLTGCDPLIAKRYLPEGIVPRPSLVWNIPLEAPRLAQELLRNGYATAAFLDDPSLSKLAGFAPGFSRFEVPSAEGWEFREGLATLGPKLEQWVENLDRDQNWFALLHVSDLERAFLLGDERWDRFFEARAELDWVPPMSDAKEVFFAVPKLRWQGAMRTLGEIEAIYDGGIRRLDHGLERLLGAVLSGERGARTTLVVLGTHGMSLGESGLIAHHGRLCDTDLHVPLAIRPAEHLSFRAGTCSQSLVSVLDVAPTLLELAGLEIPAAMQGRSLAPTLAEPSTTVREWAFASQGFQAGWVAMDARWCFESVWPEQAKTSLLADSWTGRCAADGARDLEAHREVLHDRTEKEHKGHLRAQVADRARAQQLREAAVEWERGCEQLRNVLQSSGRLTNLLTRAPRHPPAKQEGEDTR